MSDHFFERRFDTLRGLLNKQGNYDPIREFFGIAKHADINELVEALKEADWLDSPYSEVIFLAKLRARDD